MHGMVLQFGFSNTGLFSPPTIMVRGDPFLESRNGVSYFSYLSNLEFFFYYYYYTIPEVEKT